eukprot:CAMPEP_0113942904 /NCGR_PEP_ID=MMETSP1339-20121228/14779_1 /TAXON_ID=94617 /ORGANISM="Fibrocapsa japonica" /LENGTH=266 /DNA_ID=CAMNT_0000947587 /DNA_START=63 /DNA_END=863 /DNA_ORIENTATION=- /assembly_acc=CAM_ASM_000762
MALRPCTIALSLILIGLFRLSSCFVYPANSLQKCAKTQHYHRLHVSNEDNLSSAEQSEKRLVGRISDPKDIPPPEEKNPIQRFLNWTKTEEGKEDIKFYVGSVALALMVRFYVVEPRWIPSLSMYPTFQVGDQLAVDKISKLVRPYQRRDVIVFTPPPQFAQYTTRSKPKEALIKRIAAVEGDTVQIKGGKLYVNGEEQVERYTNEDAAYQFGPVQVPQGSVLVLGDNRNQSLDGHIWGFLPKENVIGRAVFKYWPPWRVGTVATE